jgi:hypothetical protein
MSTAAATASKTKAVSAKVELSGVQPKKGSVRLNAGADQGKNPIVTNVYLDRTRLAFMGVPEGHVPTKIRVHIDVLETAPESSIAPAPTA